MNREALVRNGDLHAQVIVYVEFDFVDNDFCELVFVSRLHFGVGGVLVNECFGRGIPFHRRHDLCPCGAFYSAFNDKRNQYEMKE